MRKSMGKGKLNIAKKQRPRMRGSQHCPHANEQSDLKKSGQTGEQVRVGKNLVCASTLDPSGKPIGGPSRVQRVGPKAGPADQPQGTLSQVRQEEEQCAATDHNLCMKPCPDYSYELNCPI